MRAKRTAVVAAAFAGLTMFAAPASAAPTPPGAEAADGYFYFYEHADYVGQCKHAGTIEMYSLICGNMNDKTSSVWNNAYAGRPDAVRVYENDRFGGGSMCISRGEMISNLAHRQLSNGANANDRISSHRWERGC